MPSPRTAAKFMLEKAAALGMDLSALKLQKLLYLAHGAMLARHGAPLLEGEQFAAWKYGPVMESLYHDLKIFGRNTISLESPFVKHWDTLSPDSDAGKMMESILKQFGAKSASTLIDISHLPGGPWDVVFNGPSSDGTIQDADIMEYFKKHLKH